MLQRAHKDSSVGLVLNIQRVKTVPYPMSLNICYTEILTCDHHDSTIHRRTQEDSAVEDDSVY